LTSFFAAPLAGSSATRSGIDIMQPLTREQVRTIDRLAIEELGIPGVVLMENAGRGVAEAVLDLLEQRRIAPAGAKISVLCGGGNNGGDGYVAARHLHNAGASVTLYPAVDPEQLKGDALVHARAAVKMGLAIEPIRNAEELAEAAKRWGSETVLIDALLGTGFTGEVRSHIAEIIRRCNAAHERGTAVVAVDLPSGLDCDTGRAADPTIRADVTVTFVAPKVGFSNPEAAPFLGRVIVQGIGIPPELLDRIG